jgi:hypothetical protein
MDGSPDPVLKEQEPKPSCPFKIDSCIASKCIPWFQNNFLVYASEIIGGFGFFDRKLVQKKL